MDAFLHFLSHFQKEQLSEEEVKQLIEVSCHYWYLSASVPYSVTHIMTHNVTHIVTQKL